MTEVRLTNRWHGLTAVALATVGLAMMTRRPGLLLAAAVGIAYATYARSGRTPEPTVAISRSVSDSAPAPGDDVSVTVVVTNTGEHLLPDLRIVDGVPTGLSLKEGSARLGTALRPDERVTFEYVIGAERGRHAFDPAIVIARDLPGTVEVEERIPTETTLTCLPALASTEAVPLRPAASRYVGTEPTSRGGSGIEFFATREYRPGDGLHRIDWARFARTGDLSTTVFREERSATVVLLIDARLAAYVRSPEGPHAVELGVHAAGRLFARLTDDGNRVGLAALGLEPCWLAPGTGRAHRAQARELLATHPTLSPSPSRERLRPAWRTLSTADRPDRETLLQVETIRSRLPTDAQLLLITPLCDDAITSIARRIDATGYPVTVVSPDVTTDDSAGGKLARLERQARMADLRASGLRVVEWDPETSLDASLARANRLRP